MPTWHRIWFVEIANLDVCTNQVHIRKLKDWILRMQHLANEVKLVLIHILSRYSECCIVLAPSSLG